MSLWVGKKTFRIYFEDLKQRFKLKDKYSKANDFKRWVLNIAKKELDESSPTRLTTSR